MATSVSLGNTSLSQTLSFDRQDSFRDPSFSSYLSNSEENFIVKLMALTQNASPSTMTPPSQGRQFYAGRVKDKEEDGEIGVFGAEKYFQGELEEESTRKVLSKRFSTMQMHQNDLSQAKSTSSSPNYLVSANMCSKNQEKQLGTRSVRSESSVNSQSCLLHKVPKNRACRSKGSYVKNFLVSLGCKCNDKTAVEVDEQSVEKGVACSKEFTNLPSTMVDLAQEAKTIPWAEEEIHIKLKKEDCFSFPVFNSQVQGVKTLKNKWDLAIPREEETEIQSYAESDASSDLFELESFSTNGMSSCMTPLTCYAPSEASIEWSVVTASGVDYSRFSDYKGINGKPHNLDRMVRVAKIGSQKRQYGILLGCRDLKAVEIVENEYGIAGEMIGGGGGGQGRNELAPVTNRRVN